jgi:hypothetical protein
MNTLDILKKFNAEMKFAHDKLVFYIPGGRSDAERFVELVANNIVLSLKKLNLSLAHICYRDMIKPIKLCVEMAESLKIEEESMLGKSTTKDIGIQVAEQKLSIPILRVLNYFGEQPERRSALVRLYDERQIVVTESSSVLIKGATLEEAVQRKRSSYWYLPDLEDFRRESRQSLEPNNESSFIEFSWRGVSKDGINWRRFTNKYRLIQDSYGVLYQVSHNLSVEQITTPSVILK